MELKHYFMLARKWFWLAALGLLLGAGLGYGIVQIQKPVFQAKTRILVTRTSQQSNTVDFAYLSDQQLVSTYIQLLKSRPILDAASGQVGFPVDIKAVDVSQVLDTQIIEITIEDSDAQHARDAANAMVASLLKQSESLQTAKFASTENSLNQQVEQIRVQMEELRANYDQSSQKDIQDHIAEIDTQIKNFQDEITTLQQDTARLNPPKDVNARVELSVKQARLTQIQPLLLYYQQIRSNLALLGTASQSGTAGNDDPHLAQLQSTLKLYEQLYLSLLNNLESVRLLRLQFSPNIAQIEPAVLPEKPTGFSDAVIIAISALAGLLLTAGTATLIEFMDDTIKSPADVTTMLGLTTIGCVPNIRQKPGSVFFIDEPDSPAADAIRILRKNILHAESRKKLKTLLVVSPGDKEGKTELAVNLAASFIALGSRATVVDANVRSPQLHKLFKIDNSIGLGDSLAADEAISSVVFPLEEHKALSAITAGNIPANLTEKLESDRLSVVLAKLNKTADMLILDGPALFSADTLAFASRVDGVLLVLRPGHTSMEAAREAVERLQRVGVHIVGVTLNRIPRNWENYYPGFYHGE